MFFSTSLSCSLQHHLVPAVVLEAVDVKAVPDHIPADGVGTGPAGISAEKAPAHRPDQGGMLPRVRSQCAGVLFFTSFRRMIPDYLFTTLTGLPSTKDLMLSAVMSMIRWRAAWAAQLMCGVMMQFFALRSGLSALMGSVETTSRPAA